VFADIIAEVEQKKAQLDRLRPLAPGALKNLEHSYDLELTYTSNAIEGNTLTQIETNLVIEQGSFSLTPQAPAPGRRGDQQPLQRRQLFRRRSEKSPVGACRRRWRDIQPNCGDSAPILIVAASLLLLQLLIAMPLIALDLAGHRSFSVEAQVRY
jgi:hypothetical protein